ncbi:MAG TPA: hypothetical protein VF026_16990 [Ktedonobacteraceae bacterium]
MTTVSILGSGIMGTALRFPLADNGHDVRLVGSGLRFSEVRKRMPGVTLEGAAAIVVIGGPCPSSPSAGSSNAKTSPCCAICTRSLPKMSL